MKLNRRLPFLIIPVLFTSFLLTGIGLYFIEKRAIYSLVQSSVEKEASELAGSLNAYTYFAGGTLASIVQSDALRRYTLTSDQYLRTLAFDSAIDDILDSAADLPAKYFSVMFLRSDGVVDYYYEESLDPFAEPSQELISWVSQLFVEKKQENKGFVGSSAKIAVARVLTSDTLRPGFAVGNSENFAIAVFISPSLFKTRRLQLEQEGRSVTLLPQKVQQSNFAQLSTQRDIPGFGSLAVKAGQEEVEQDLQNVLLKMILWFLGLAVVTHLALQWLLKKYVTGPIKQLEHQFSHIDLDGTNEITAYEANDEIGSLNASFIRLYDSFKETYEKTRELAEKDSLTKLYNRRVFSLTLSQLISRADRGGGNGQVALLYIDIDNFKYVNDHFGHAVGDMVLQSFAYKLHEITRGRDAVFDNIAGDENITSARLAGDEFSVIIYDYCKDDVPRRVAERILMTCENGFSCAKGDFPITLSIGVATYPKDGETAEELVINADSAMYESKKSGKNTISYYSAELSEYARHQQEIEVELKRLDAGELELYYMPIVDAQTGRVKGFEALLRWFSAELGQIPPDTFISMAENLGLYQKIDMWVLERAFEDAPVLWEKYGEHVEISINISAAEFFSMDFVDKLFLLVESKEIAPERFTIEITETFYRDHTASSLERLKRIKDAGFRLAIDDFGSGFTSIIQLVDFPIDIVKLDRLFIMKAVENQKFEVIRSLVGFCHDQKLLVIAEGVETQEGARKLRDAGCDAIQGYYFSRPQALNQLIGQYHEGKEI